MILYTWHVQLTHYARNLRLLQRRSGIVLLITNLRLRTYNANCDWVNQTFNPF